MDTPMCIFSDREIRQLSNLPKKRLMCTFKANNIHTCTHRTTTTMLFFLRLFLFRLVCSNNQNSICEQMTVLVVEHRRGAMKIK